MSSWTDITPVKPCTCNHTTNVSAFGKLWPFVSFYVSPKYSVKGLFAFEIRAHNEGHSEQKSLVLDLTRENLINIRNRIDSVL